MAAYARALLSVIAISITLEVLWTGGISRPPRAPALLISRLVSWGIVD
ncbi:hypothetical protein YM3MPS_37150 [Mycobacterium pseudoshottsii]|nr:hypothetical protein DL240490_01091 [Mycobacterium marinum]BEH77912.1 hypothetical protein YM3MPS_37150 [Mycobacterium pseudoshottsii]